MTISVHEWSLCDSLIQSNPYPHLMSGWDWIELQTAYRAQAAKGELFDMKVAALRSSRLIFDLIQYQTERRFHLLRKGM